MTMAGGALWLAASASASARRTSGDGSSSSISIAPSAAARSSGDRSEYKYARASAPVASARSLAGAVRTHCRKSRTIMLAVLPIVLEQVAHRAARIGRRGTGNAPELADDRRDRAVAAGVGKQAMENIVFLRHPLWHRFGEGGGHAGGVRRHCDLSGGGHNRGRGKCRRSSGNRNGGYSARDGSGG